MIFMSFIKEKNKKGVAIIWALVAMLVIVLVVTGILMMAQVFNKRENTAVIKTQADYYARSGINIISSQITSGELDEILNKKSDEDGNYDIDQTTGSQANPINLVIEITDESEKIPVSIKIDRTRAYYQLDIQSTYTKGNIEANVYGRMVKSEDTSKWVFDGFYVK